MDFQDITRTHTLLSSLPLSLLTLSRASLSSIPPASLPTSPRKSSAFLLKLSWP